MKSDIQHGSLKRKSGAAFFHRIVRLADAVENPVRENVLVTERNAAELSGKGLFDRTVSEIKFQHRQSLAFIARCGLDADVVADENAADASAELSDSAGGVRADQLFCGIRRIEPQRTLARTGAVEQVEHLLFRRAVERFAVGGNDIRHIIRLAEASLDFERCDAEFT